MNDLHTPFSATCLHACWRSRGEWARDLYGIGSREWAEALENPGVCFLPDGHEGPHVWTPDDQVEIYSLPQVD